MTQLLEAPHSAESRDDRSTRERVTDVVRWIAREQVGSTRPAFADQMAGFALDVKPAVTFERDISEADEDHLRNELALLGVDVEIHDRLIVNPAAVERRVREERDFAHEVGWDFDGTLEDNIGDAIKDGLAQDDDKLGFLLGYPASAIRAYRKERGLKARGIVHPTDIEPGPDWDKGLAAEMNAFLEKQSAMVESYIEPLSKPGADAKALGDRQYAERRRLIDEYEPVIREVYTRYLGASVEEVDFMLTWERRKIMSPGGTVIYAFAIAGESGAKEPDVLELEQKVDRAFRDAA